MPNPNLIKPKQLDSTTFDLIRQIESGDIGQALFAYSNTGYHGPNILYITGGTQTVQGQKTFTLSPGVPYSGNNSQTISKLYISDQVDVLQNAINILSGDMLHVTGNESALGIKTFESVVIDQGITGTSVNFGSGRFTSAVLVPSPTNSQSAINLSYFYNQGVVFTTGDQTILGNKTFITAPTLSNTATGIHQAARFDQLVNTGIQLQIQINALAKASGSRISGFGGVISFNGRSGSIFSIGRGNVTVQQQGDIAYISGAMPILSGSGVYLIQGEQGLLGPYFHPRGNWQGGLTYSYLDVVNLSGNAWVSVTGHLSSASNQPGTGGALAVAPWHFLISSGNRGASGYSGYSGYSGFSGYSGDSGYSGYSGRSGYSGYSGFSGRSGFSSFSGYSGYSSASGYSGYSSASGYSGYSSTSGYSGYSAQSGYSGASGYSGFSGATGPVGLYINSGTITGNFTNLSFYLDFPSTGLYLSEAWTPQPFTFTGYAIGCTTSGFGPIHLSSGFSGLVLVNQMTGSIYQRDSNNTIQEITPFSFNSGIFTQVVGGFAVAVTGLNRVGLSIYSGLSGLRGLSFMVAGF